MDNMILLTNPNPDPNPNPNPNPKPPAALCEGCGSNPWKYRCPGCSIRSCSLPCVNAHKRRTGCTGKRSLAEVVPISEFDDNLLISDYNMLEEVKRLAESARRMRGESNEGPRFRLPRHLQSLWTATRRRGMRIWFMPSGMSRRENNKTRYSQWKQSIFWSIEWRFHSTDVVLIDHDVHERANLSTVIEKHLTPSPWNTQLTPYCNSDLDDLKFFLKKNEKFPDSPFRRLNINAPLGKQLMKTNVLEYPIIHVFLPTYDCDFEIEKWEPPVANWKPPASSGSILSAAEGPPKREEEIEDDASPPRVMNYVSSTCLKSTQPKDVVPTKEDNSNVQMPASAEVTVAISCDKGEESHVAEEDDRYSKSAVDTVKFSEDEIFDFDDELRDAYSDFIGEMNPDDFLCFNDGQDELIGQGAVDPLFTTAQLLLQDDEELEEGEIPDSSLAGNAF